MSVRLDKKTGTWTAIVYNAGKQIWRRGFPTKRAAQKAEVEIREGLRSPSLHMKFDELARLFFKHQMEVNRISTKKTNESRYECHVKPYIGQMYVDKITARDIQNIVYRMTSSDKNYSTCYINNIVETASKIFNYGIDMGYVISNPAKKVRKRKEEATEDTLQYIKLEEFQKLYEASDTDQYFQTLLLVLFFSGIRVGECRALLWKQINFESNSMVINAHINDKGGRTRVNGRKNNKNYTIYMAKNVREALLNIYQQEKKKDGFNENRYVFGFFEPYSYNKIWYRYKRLLKKAGLRDMKIHALRHGYASMLANNGATIQELAFALGDTLDVTIRTYSHMYENTNQLITQRIDNIIDKEKCY